MTSPSPLERLAGPGNVLAKEPPDAKEFEGLVRSGLARLKDARNDANALESRFDLVQRRSRALSGGASAPRVSPIEAVHRLSGATGHSRPVQVARYLCHDMRNRTEHEGAFDVDEASSPI